MHCKHPVPVTKCVKFAVIIDHRHFWVSVALKASDWADDFWMRYPIPLCLGFLGGQYPRKVKEQFDVKKTDKNISWDCPLKTNSYTIKPVKDNSFFATLLEKLHVEHGDNPVQSAHRRGMGRTLQGKNFSMSMFRANWNPTHPSPYRRNFGVN